MGLGEIVQAICDRLADDLVAVEAGWSAGGAGEEGAREALVGEEGAREALVGAVVRYMQALGSLCAHGSDDGLPKLLPVVVKATECGDSFVALHGVRLLTDLLGDDVHAEGAAGREAMSGVVGGAGNGSGAAAGAGQEFLIEWEEAMDGSWWDPLQQGEEAGEEDGVGEGGSASLLAGMSTDARAAVTMVRMGRTADFKEAVARDPELLRRVTDANGNTLLHMAVREGKKTIVKEVLRHPQELDPLVRNKEGANAADLAKHYHFAELEKYLLEKVPHLADPISAEQAAEVDKFVRAAAEKKAAAERKRADERALRAEEKRKARVQQRKDSVAEGGGGAGRRIPVELQEQAVAAVLRHLEPATADALRHPRAAPALLARMRELEQAGNTAKMTLENVAKRYPGSPVVRERRALGGMEKVAWLSGASEADAATVGVGWGDMGADGDVRQSLEGSLRPIFSSPTRSVRARVTTEAGDPLSFAPGAGAAVGGSPLKGVGAGNNAELVRKARQLEDTAVAQAEVASSLASALSALETRRAAVGALASLPCAHAERVVSRVSSLVAADEDAAVRAAALRSLRKYLGEVDGGGAELLRVVLKALEDRDPQVRLAALRALPRVAAGNHKTVATALTHMLFDTSPAFAPRAAATLGTNAHYDFRLGASAASRDPTAASMQRGGEGGESGTSMAVLAAAVSGLAMVAGSDIKMVVRAAIEGLRHDAWHVRRAASQVLQVSVCPHVTLAPTHPATQPPAHPSRALACTRTCIRTEMLDTPLEILDTQSHALTVRRIQAYPHSPFPSPSLPPFYLLPPTLRCRPCVAPQPPQTATTVAGAVW